MIDDLSLHACACLLSNHKSSIVNHKFRAVIARAVPGLPLESQREIERIFESDLLRNFGDGALRSLQQLPRAHHPAVFEKLLRRLADLFAKQARKPRLRYAAAARE